jgi:hypothetical protein
MFIRLRGSDLYRRMRSICHQAHVLHGPRWQTAGMVIKYRSHILKTHIHLLGRFRNEGIPSFRMAT